MAKNTKKINITEEKQKAKWLGLLFLAIGLFTAGLFTGNIIFTLLALGLGLYTYTKGDNIIFKEYNEKRAKKAEEMKPILEAQKKIAREGKLFKK